MSVRPLILDRLRFVGVHNSAGGDVGGGTTFRYRQDGDTVWADDAGGDVERGHLIGTRTADELSFRYVHLDRCGRTASGRCSSRVVALADGGIELHEDWAWESRPGTGRSIVRQVR